MEAKAFTTTFLNEEIPCYYIKDRAEAHAALQRMMEQDTLFAIDTETEALPEYKHIEKAPLSPHLGKIRLIQTFNNRAAVVFDMKFINCPEMFFEFLSSKRFVAHNALFDLMFFLKMGVPEMNIGCTMQLAKMMFHASQADDGGLQAGLAPIVHGLFGEDVLKHVQASDWSVPELNFEQIEYAALDAILCLRVAEKLAPVVTGYKMERYYRLIKAVQYPIARIQLNGCLLDVEAHRNLVDNWLSKLNDARKAVVAVTGNENITPATIAEWLESKLDKQVLSLWPRTESGKLQTDAHAFADFGDISPVVKPFAHFQKIKTLTQDFGNKLLQMVNPATGRLHASYMIQGARTGRMSCRAPNLQQLPRDEEVRKNFIATPGKVMIRADYSQIELRVAAELSRDAEMLNAYKKGIDLHNLTASRLLGKPVDQITKPERSMAKAINFGFCFGLGAKKFSHYAKKAYGVNVTLEESKDAIKTYRETYAGYHEWQKAQAEEAAVTLLAFTPCGKRRRLDPENTYGTSMNTPVQGGAAECMEYSLCMLQSHADEQGFDIINVIHDEIIVESDEDPRAIAMAEACIRDSMIWGFKKVFPEGITRDLACPSHGKNWVEAK